MMKVLPEMVAELELQGGRQLLESGLIILFLNLNQQRFIQKMGTLVNMEYNIDLRLFGRKPLIN